MCNSVLLSVSHCFALSWPGRSCKWERVLNEPTWLNKGELSMTKDWLSKIQWFLNYMFWNYASGLCGFVHYPASLLHCSITPQGGVRALIVHLGPKALNVSLPDNELGDINQIEICSLNQIKSNQIKSNQILFVTYTWLADVNASVAKCLCF
jgi:hypothetical protein